MTDTRRKLQEGLWFQTDHGPRSFAQGDRLLFTRNDQTLNVRNGNVGTLVSFRVGATDAPLLAKQFAADLPTPRDLVNLPNYQMFVKLMINGVQSKPFTARTTMS